MAPLRSRLEVGIRVHGDVVNRVHSEQPYRMVAGEMQREGFSLPLMIGGATTSKAHTAVKIDPHYDRDVIVYVPDASRSVAVATQLMNASKADFVQQRKEEYQMVRERVANRKPRSRMLRYTEATDNALKPEGSLQEILGFVTE